MPFNPDNILLTAGATAALEILSFCLGEAGDAFLVPSPYYPGYGTLEKSILGISKFMLIVVSMR